jgi:two-component system sensor histidine kinase VicK
MDTKAANILARITELANEIYFIYNITERKVEHLSAAFESVTYLERELVLRHPRLLMMVIHKEDHTYLLEKVRYILKDKDPSIISFRIIREDGQLRWLKLNLFPIVTEEGMHYLTGIAEDETARRTSLLTMEKITAWQNAKLEILSYDLQEPLAAMQTLVSSIAGKLPDNPEVAQLRKMITEVADSSVGTIQHLLKHDLLVSNNVNLKAERLDVVWEIKQALAVYIQSQVSLEKKIKFSHSREEVYAEIDSLKFVQILNSLFSNAVKFTGTGGNISIHLELNDTNFLIRVEDDGVGISKTHQKQIFDKHAKTIDSKIGEHDEIGLSLWVVKSLIEQHSGKIWLESTEGYGSIFFVEIPLKQPDYTQFN